MPWDAVLSKFKSGSLHSGSDKGPKVKDRRQAIAIMLSEKRSNKKEYHGVGPSSESKVRMKGKG